jgi:hypothetical protein
MQKRIMNNSLSPRKPETLEAITAESHDEGDAKSQAAPTGSESTAPEKTLEANAEGPIAPVATESAAMSMPEEKTQEVNAESPAPPASPASASTSTPEENAQQADAERPVAPASSPSTETPAPPARMTVHGIPEYVRDEDGKAFTWRIQYTVASYNVKAATYEQKLRNERRVLPSDTEAYGTTRELFERIKQAISQQTQLDERNSALCTYWVFSSWFQELLSCAPCLAITGWPHEGETVLRTLRAFCRNGFLVEGLKRADLRGFYYEVLTPTFLIYAPNLTKSMVSFLACATRRGFYERKNHYFDYFGPKAIYVGENMPVKSMLAHSVHVNASPTPGSESTHPLPLTKDVMLHFQNQLLAYRIAVLHHVYQSEFTVTGLTAESNTIACALGSCIVQAPDLQTELVSLLTPYSDEQMAERWDGLEPLAVGAALHLAHQGKVEILVGEIAAEANKVLAGRGERLRYSPEQTGHALKRAGLLRRRLGPAGNGFVMDHATQVRLHEVAKSYGCAGLFDGQENLHCPFCQ